MAVFLQEVQSCVDVRSWQLCTHIVITELARVALSGCHHHILWSRLLTKEVAYRSVSRPDLLCEFLKLVSKLLRQNSKRANPIHNCVWYSWLSLPFGRLGKGKSWILDLVDSVCPTASALECFLGLQADVMTNNTSNYSQSTTYCWTIHNRPLTVELFTIDHLLLKFVEQHEKDGDGWSVHILQTSLKECGGHCTQCLRCKIFEMHKLTHDIQTDTLQIDCVDCKLFFYMRCV